MKQLIIFILALVFLTSCNNYVPIKMTHEEKIGVNYDQRENHFYLKKKKKINWNKIYRFKQKNQEFLNEMNKNASKVKKKKTGQFIMY